MFTPDPDFYPIPDLDFPPIPDLDFPPIPDPDPGFTGQKSTGSGYPTLYFAVLRIQNKAFLSKPYPEICTCSLFGLNQCWDPHHFDAYPDPTFHFDPDPDPACHFHADPDPVFLFGVDPYPAFQIKARTLKKCSNTIGSYSIHFGFSSEN
jgi:hypothetical protein